MNETETKRPVPTMQTISNCERPEHPVVEELRAISTKLFESGQQFFLLGLIFTDEGDSLLTQGINTSAVHDPNVFGEIESRLLDECRVMRKKKVVSTMKKMLGMLEGSDDSDK